MTYKKMISLLKAILNILKNTGLSGLGSKFNKLTQWRYKLLILLFAILLIFISYQTISLAINKHPSVLHTNFYSITGYSRPDIIDRNGLVLATDVKVHGVYAENCKILNPDITAIKINSIFPELSVQNTRRKLSKKGCFSWLKREISVQQKKQLISLGIPGLRFIKKYKRFYPQGSETVHLLGRTDIDNRGISGLELYLDRAGLMQLQKSGLTIDNLGNKQSMQPLQLSIDQRIQHIIHNQLSKAIDKYNAKAASALLLSIKDAEVFGFVSLPDFNPNLKSSPTTEQLFNRLSTGVYELGSVIKTISLAIGLDTQTADLSTMVDTSKPFKVKNKLIKDFHAQNRWLSVREIYTHSSNIGAAQIILHAGVDAQKYYYKKLGLIGKIRTELPEVSAPLLPKIWNELTAATMSYGYGYSLSPLQFMTAINTIVNDGKFLYPTFLLNKNKLEGKVIIKAKTSKDIIELFRENVIKGSGKLAAAPGYLVGGKTGTAEKIINGKYSKHFNRNSFVSIFPFSHPKYILYVMIDEPRDIKKGTASGTASTNAAPVSGNIIQQTAPLLGIIPNLIEEDTLALSIAKKILIKQQQNNRLDQ